MDSGFCLGQSTTHPKRGEKDEKSLISLRRPHKAPIWEKILVAIVKTCENPLRDKKECYVLKVVLAE